MADVTYGDWVVSPASDDYSESHFQIYARVSGHPLRGTHIATLHGSRDLPNAYLMAGAKKLKSACMDAVAALTSLDMDPIRLKRYCRQTVEIIDAALAASRPPT